jgi:hypothetical protein
MDINDKNKTQDMVWQWDQPEIAANKEQNIHKKGAWVQFTLMFSVALVFLLFHRIVISVIIFFLSFVILVGIFIAPPVLRFFNKAGKILAELTGRLLTYLLLVPFYFLCFFPGRIILFMLGKDPMKRKLDHSSSTYWVEKKQTEEIDHYKVQYK